MLQPARPVAGLFLDLARRGLGRRLVGVEQPAGQLPVPHVGYESVAPGHQHVLAGIVENDGHGGRLHRHGVVLEPLPRRHLDVSEPDGDPLVLVDRPLAVGDPPGVLVLRARHP